MARKLHIVESAKSGQSSTEVPQDVKDDVETAYAEFLRRPNTEGYFEFDTEDEKKTWIKQARSYCNSREAGALKFRQLPSKHLTADKLRFQITTPKPEDAATNESATSDAKVPANA
jgi:hypothetical protein